MRRSSLGAACGLIASAALTFIPNAQAGPLTTADPVAALSHSAAARAKLRGGLALVFGQRPSLNPQRRILPAQSHASVLVELAELPDSAALAALEKAGLRITLSKGAPFTIGRHVHGRTDPAGLLKLVALTQVQSIELDGPPLGLVPPMDVTAAEIDAVESWRTLDGADLNMTGHGIRVCDSDSGIDIFHPSFFRADGGYIDWVDVNDNGRFDPGIDGIDPDGDGTITGASELLRVLNSEITGYFNDDPLYGSGDPSYQVGLDWLYVDSNNNKERDFGRNAGFDDSSPAFGEPLFTLDDVNHNGRLDVGEKLVALNTSKVAVARINGKIYRRGEDLIDTERSADSAHGTSAAAVMAGGHWSLLSKTGIAPDSELVIAARGDVDGDLVELAQFCMDEGARVVLHEYAPWVGYHLDGSSPMATLMDSTSAAGVAHINPAGNLSTSNKLSKRDIPAAQTTTLTIAAPELGQPYRTVGFTLLWREVSRPLTITLESPTGQMQVAPAGGFVYDPWYGPLYFYAERSNSSRGTAMLTVYVFPNDGPPTPLLTGDWKVHVEDASPVGTPDLEMIGYAIDDLSGWGQGVQFPDYVSEDHLVGWPGTADSSIAIAAYTGTGLRSGTVGQRASYSGRGYRIDGFELLSVSGPADPVVAGYKPNKEAHYSIYGGTSGASPHVAGVAALLLQQDPNRNGFDVRQALRDGALVDDQVGSVPNYDWGYGKVRAYNSLYGEDPTAGSRPGIAGPIEVLTVGETREINLQLTDSDEPVSNLSVHIDRDYDGTYDELLAGNVLSVTFDEVGRYYSKLRVTDAGGLSDTALATFIVRPASEPQAPIDETPPDLTGRSCGCRVVGRRTSSGYGALLLLGLGLIGLRRRRR